MSVFVWYPTGEAKLADAAGVSVETIHKSVGTKAVLLHKAWDITVGGDDQDIVFHERPEVLAGRRPEVPDMLVKMNFVRLSVDKDAEPGLDDGGRA